jgi:hypothetical protein
MQLKLSKIIPAAALFLAGVTPVLSDSHGIREPVVKARAHRNLARSIKNDSVEKRENGVPGTYYNILMGETACGGYFQPHDFVSFYLCYLFPF